MRASSCIGLGGLLLTACTSGPPVPHGPYTTPPEAARSALEAERLNRVAADLIASDPKHAEALLREALTADLFYGPAHNNLGVLYLNAGKLYEAANEFEWAKKLMPEQPDPKVNLALTMESAGRIEDALDLYGATLEIVPDYLPAMKGIASLTLQGNDRPGPELRSWLKAIAIRGNPAWRQWARERLERLRIE